MLSPAYQEIKKLRSTGRSDAAYARMGATPPISDEDAFEAAVCLFVCGDMVAAISPFNAFLIMQGIETVALRMDRICENTVWGAKS